jgi:crotonobetainyl-CoA:carnitine CoA-transferase CaiB-like acyl-CoA transferase
MRKSVAVASLFAGLFMTQWVVAQQKQPRDTRRPAATAEASPQSAPAPSGDYFSILNGMPMLLELHHDTEVGTGKAIDVYMFVIEMQIMNSDGYLEPVGLQIHNYYTAIPMDSSNDVYPFAARDCNTWNKIVLRQMSARKPGSKSWPYVEFTTAQGARVVQTNEDGAVWWSDDIQCWGSSDRFPPF